MCENGPDNDAQNRRAEKRRQRHHSHLRRRKWAPARGLESARPPWHGMAGSLLIIIYYLYRRRLLEAVLEWLDVISINIAYMFGRVEPEGYFKKAAAKEDKFLYSNEVGPCATVPTPD